MKTKLSTDHFKNPFIHNYVFKDFDINRVKIKKWQYPLLWLLPTYTQLTMNYAIHYKQWMNKYFIIGFEEFPPKEHNHNISE